MHVYILFSLTKILSLKSFLFSGLPPKDQTLCTNLSDLVQEHFVFLAFIG